MSRDEFHNLAEVQLNLNSAVKTYWGNLGLWSADSDPAKQDYAEACSRMAQLLGDSAQLNHQDIVIDVGFGCGDQLLLWLQQYGVEQLYGLNISRSQTQLSQQRLATAGYAQQAEQLSLGSNVELLEWASASLFASPTKMIALDCAYHFTDRLQFLADSYQLLAPQGQLMLCDLLLDDRGTSLTNKLVLKVLCRLCKIPYTNLLKHSDYLAKCRALGFEVEKFDDITEQVFLPFGQWLQAYKLQHADKSIAWSKYTGTAWFLRWAKQHGVLRYAVISLSKP